MFLYPLTLGALLLAGSPIQVQPVAADPCPPGCCQTANCDASALAAGQCVPVTTSSVAAAPATAAVPAIPATTGPAILASTPTVAAAGGCDPSCCQPRN